MNKREFAAIFREYCDSEIDTDFVEIFPDPKVEDCFAVRVSTPNLQMDFLITHYHPENGAAWNAIHSLEECEFETWPPKSGPLQWL